MKTRICKGDHVQVISGRGSGKRRIKDGEDASDRGQRGEVISIDRKKGTAIVKGLKMVYRHRRATDQNRSNGGRIEMEAPIHLSNLMLVDPASDDVTRVGVRMESVEREGGKVKIKRTRVAKKTGADIAERS